MGIVESRLIHDPLDETESLLGSSPVLFRSDEKSPFRTSESRLARLLFKVSNLGFERGDTSKGEKADGEEPSGGRNCRASEVVTVELVAGREDGGGNVPLTPANSPTFLFFDVGRGGVEGSGRARARPAAATPTVLDAISCADALAQVISQQVKNA